MVTASPVWFSMEAQVSTGPGPGLALQVETARSPGGVLASVNATVPAPASSLTASSRHDTSSARSPFQT